MTDTQETLTHVNPWKEAAEEERLLPQLVGRAYLPREVPMYRIIRGLVSPQCVDRVVEEFMASEYRERGYMPLSVSHDAVDPVLDALFDAAEFFGMDVWGMYESPQVFRYQDNHQPQDWHSDYNVADRSKVTCVTLLTDPDEGCSGKLELQMFPGLDLDLKPGDAVTFPGWVAHRVAPPATGRMSLVGWLAGPELR